MFVGDACEAAEDDLDRVSGLASELGRLKTPVFTFLEGRNPQAEIGFRKIADVSGGAFGRFDARGVKQLGGLLRAAAAVAIGGVQALEGRKDEASALILGQMKKGG